MTGSSTASHRAEPRASTSSGSKQAATQESSASTMSRRFEKSNVWIAAHRAQSVRVLIQSLIASRVTGRPHGLTWALCAPSLFVRLRLLSQPWLSIASRYCGAEGARPPSLPARESSPREIETSHRRRAGRSQRRRVTVVACATVMRRSPHREKIAGHTWPHWARRHFVERHSELGLRRMIAHQGVATCGRTEC